MTSPQPLDYAKQHFDEAEKMKKTMQFRWSTVAYFYSAMHMVHAGLATMTNLSTADQAPISHTGRQPGKLGTNVVVETHVPQLINPYESLYNEGVKVRYRGGQVSADVLEMHRRAELPVIADWACRRVHDDPKCDCWLRRM